MKISSKKLNIAEFQDKSLLIVDDDDPFRNRLGRAMENKGFKPFLAKSVEEAIIMVKKALAVAAIDLRLLDGNGLDVVQEIHR